MRILYLHCKKELEEDYQLLRKKETLTNLEEIEENERKVEKYRKDLENISK